MTRPVGHRCRIKLLFVRNKLEKKIQILEKGEWEKAEKSREVGWSQQNILSQNDEYK